MQNMAGFFKLGGGASSTTGGGDADREESTSNPNTQNIFPTTTTTNINPSTSTSSPPAGLLLYRNEEIYQKGFEIWQQYVQVHQYPKLIHHHHLLSPSQPTPSQTLDVSHYHHHHHYPFQYYPFHTSTTTPAGPSFRPSSSNRAAIMTMMPHHHQPQLSSATGSSSVTMNCQDCGNQAKKDCAHMRCRTCCRSRGFDCPTHVKSTWVPAAKRRERQHQLQLTAKAHQLDTTTTTSRIQDTLEHEPEMSSDTSKRLRENTGLEVAHHFPSEVTSDAVFRCVKVHSIDEHNHQLAYQTMVNISGHLFKGILYDQGPEQSHAVAGESSVQHQHINILTGEGGHTTVTNSTAGENSVTTNLLDPTVYPTPINAFLAGTQFFPPPTS